MKIRPVSAHVGAEITDIDLAQVTATDVDELSAAWAEYGVLFFRDQDLTPEEHLAFAEHFSDVDVNRFFAPVEDHPKIAQVLKEPHQLGNIGGGWHTDHSYDEIPARGSILLARDVPPVGGDTRFCSVGAAYDALSDGLKETLATLRAVHSSKHVFGTEAQYVRSSEGRLGNPESVPDDVVHPVVIAHPVTGRPLLYVNGAFTIRFEGWTAEESAPLLKMLYEHIAQPHFGYQFKWEVGSIAMWDNRSTWHWALNDYHGHRRLMHRITIEGEPLSPAA